jgi:hypothetical protein
MDINKLNYLIRLKEYELHRYLNNCKRIGDWYWEDDADGIVLYITDNLNKKQYIYVMHSAYIESFYRAFKIFRMNDITMFYKITHQLDELYKIINGCHTEHLKYTTIDFVNSQVIKEIPEPNIRESSFYTYHRPLLIRGTPIYSVYHTDVSTIIQYDGPKLKQL